jgi:hypothetical protein
MVSAMYMVAIAWLYVVILMSITERSVTAGLVTFFFYGVFPLAIVLWIGGTGRRREMRRRAEAAEPAPDNAAGPSPSMPVGDHPADPDQRDAKRD